jgi:hypothetical protein
MVTLSVPLFFPALAGVAKLFNGLFSLLSPIRNGYCKNILTTNDTNRTPRLMSDARRHSRRAFKALMRSHHLKIPKYDLPLRFRPVSRAPPSPRPTHILINLFL